MKIANTKKLPIIVIALAMLGGQVAEAEQYHVIDGDSAQSCQSGTKSDLMTIQGPRDVHVARADGDTVNAAICVSDDSTSVVNVRWRANGYWQSSGNISHGCAEILGASKIKVRPVNSNFHETATYYTCVKE